MFGFKMGPRLIGFLIQYVQIPESHSSTAKPSITWEIRILQFLPSRRVNQNQKIGEKPGPRIKTLLYDLIILTGGMLMGPDVNFLSLSRGCVSDASPGTMMSGKIGCGFQKQDKAISPGVKYLKQNTTKLKGSADMWGPHM